jgi:hypothetical protein
METSANIDRELQLMLAKSKFYGSNVLLQKPTLPSILLRGMATNPLLETCFPHGHSLPPTPNCCAVSLRLTQYNRRLTQCHCFMVLRLISNYIYYYQTPATFTTMSVTSSHDIRVPMPMLPSLSVLTSLTQVFSYFLFVSLRSYLLLYQ